MGKEPCEIEKHERKTRRKKKQKRDERDTEDEGSGMGTRGNQQRRVGGGQAKVRHSWALSSSNIAAVPHIHSASGSFRRLADGKK